MPLLPSDNIAGSATLFTSSVLTVENGSIHTASRTKNDVEMYRRICTKTCTCTKVNGKSCSKFLCIEHCIKHHSQASLLGTGLGIAMIHYDQYNEL